MAAEELPQPVATAGLAAWRDGLGRTVDDETGRGLAQRRRLPVIIFPLRDVLLIGQTKQMHLFEPRWVNMVDAARKDYNGIFGMVYLDDDMDVVRVATVVEVVEFTNLGSQGRVVVVRGVGRAEVWGLAPEVLDWDSWGLGVVEEVPEIRLASEDGRQTAHEEASAVAEQLSALMAELDLNVPNAPSQGPTPGGKPEEDEDEASSKAPRLWGHEKVSPKEEFQTIAGPRWGAQKEEVLRRLQGVPLCVEPANFDTQAVEMPAAVFYAALAGAKLRSRIELFADVRLNLKERIAALQKQIVELQGMARAKRALAGVFIAGPPEEAAQQPGPE